MDFNLIFVCITLCVLVKICSGGSVLFLPPMTSASHKLAMVVWADALAERGHQVYWWAPAAKLDKYQPSKTSHVDHYEVDVEDRKALEMFKYENSSFMNKAAWEYDFLIPSGEFQVTAGLIPMCENVLKNHKKSVDWVLSRKYDLVIVDELFNPCGYLITQLIDAPVATYVSTCRTTASSNQHNGVAVPRSTIPYMGLTRHRDHLSYFERVKNVVLWSISYVGVNYWFGAMTQELEKTYPNIKPLETGLQRPSMQFVCMPKQIDVIGPTMPNIVYIGGINIASTVKPLNEDLRKMIDSAKKGFVLMAMGHWAKWNHAPKHVIQVFKETFRRMSSDYLIIWQYNGPVIPDLPSHVKTMAWIPQSSLLAEPKCRIFITHAGCNSFSEVIHYSVPTIAIPLFHADQYDGSVKIRTMGLGLYFNKLHLDVNELSNGIEEILTNNSYRENVKKLSHIVKNEPLTPKERAVFYSEFAMKHKRSDQHKTPHFAVHSSVLKYYCLDVLFTGIFCVFVLLWLTFKVSILLVRLIFFSRKN